MKMKFGKPSKKKPELMKSTKRKQIAALRSGYQTAGK
jgi:hypothetical protein